MKTTRVMAAAVLIVGSGLAQCLALAQETTKSPPTAPTIAGVMAGTKRIDLQRHDLGVPGREVIQVCVRARPGSGGSQTLASGRRDHLCPRRDVRV